MLLQALFDLLLGLQMPNLTWTSEITPIKQSGSVLLALVGPTVYTVLAGGLYLLLFSVLGAAVYLFAVAAVTLLLCLLLYRWHKTRGARIFAGL